nr:protein DEHYDRATION-INDUCED 19 homolog 4-like [Ipomoea batatas]GMD66444.1 protein DEHYDRATION-INDUCED 19 homolog 4-like [Ipomoea batatas]GME05583.1 protein DEHYDRATION-INDUCED 19 homolog 4-like [Ipomoea batatas]
MDSDPWIRFPTSSRRHQSRSDIYNIGDEYEGDEETRPEFMCPFCAEDYDVVGLCCHIDEEHTIEAKNGVCPVCGTRVGMDLVGHITMQHGSLLKVQRKRRYRRGSNSTLALLRRELREGNLQSFIGGSSYLGSLTTEADPLLSSFMYHQPLVDEPPAVLQSPAEDCSMKESSVDDFSERNTRPSPISEKDQEEKARKCDFVQSLVLSTFLDDNF